MPIHQRPEIERVPPVVHGGFHSEHQTDWLDFSSNVNPFGPSPRIWEAMAHAPVGRHPDPRATRLRLALAAREDVDPERLLVGNGSVELIYNLAAAYLAPGDRVLVVAPTFGEYAAASAIMGAHVVEWRTRPEDDFALNLEGLLEQVRTSNPRALFLCNPNNPTGQYVPRQEIQTLLDACPDTLVVLDQAFIRFVDEPWDVRPLLDAPNLLLLRSLTKDYALTGLRVGYALAAASVIAAIEKVQPPWSVNIMAEVATLAALDDEEHLTHSLAALARAKSALVQELARLRMRVVPSAANYLLVEVPSAVDFARRLREHKIVVRDGTSFGLPQFVRIAVRKPEENARLIAAIRELV
jgi:L-threonine-O-3-phosphate decarboxylase